MPDQTTPLEGPPASPLAMLDYNEAILTVRIREPRFGQEAAPLIAEMIHDELDAIDGPLRFVVLDFTDVGFISSAGLGTCLAILQEVRNRDAAVVIFGLGPDLRALFEITRTDGVFNVVDDAMQLAEILDQPA